MNANASATPYYVVYQDRLEANLRLIADVARRSGAHVIMALKANALWRTFHLVKPWFQDAAASSVNEVRLANDFLGGEVHAFSPAYTDRDIEAYLSGCTHITFNSLGQYRRFAPRAKAAGLSVGLRVNPHCSVIDTDLYNPALSGSRFGVAPADLAEGLPEGLDGLHFHALCESGPRELASVIEAFEQGFGRHIDALKWVNMGGGHLMTRGGYDTDLLVDIIGDFRHCHPGVEVILEPGSAFTWQTGDLVSSVVDVVTNDGVNTAVLDVSFACHMPDTLEMPYRPAVAEASEDGDWECRLGGCSCLSGDWVEGYRFAEPLRVGDTVTLRDMNHYTNVKTTMFNGIPHPAIVLRDRQGQDTVLRQYGYEDYRDRVS